MKITKRVKLAIIGAGGWGEEHAKNFKAIPGCRIVAACDSNATRAEEFAKKHGIPEVFSSVGKLLKRAKIDAVSIVTPDRLHLPVTLECLAHGKHVLCEKPLALNHADAKKMVAAAGKAGVVNMVNFTYRNWPCLQSASASIRRGDIGEIRHVEASYLQAWLASKIWGDWRTTPAWLWRLSAAHGSKGVLGDVGVHIVDFATYPAGPLREVSCRLKSFPKAPGNKIGKYRLDANDSAVMTVEFANGALGVIHTSRWVGGHANRLFLKISGTLGTIEIDSDRSTTSYRECRGHGLDKCKWKEIACKPVLTNFQKFIKAIRTGTPGEPDFARGAEVQKVLDACIESDARHLPVRISQTRIR
ncbi:MAG: Gfo/Idh/MocA family oxidoreductase [Verrucomicrobiales bacterium]|nr:Gfo/Idh/MocA family oxidoreductase [Verrucomicrobiales bacterium]